MAEISQIQQLLNNLPQIGEVKWIGVRPGRGMAVVVLQEAEISLENGVEGDRYGGRPGSARQVTLISKEHLEAVGSMLGRESIDPALTRRNIVVSGINLLALKGKLFKIGDAVLEYTGLCHPCSKMETALGAGGYNAMRGHGGITAKVMQSGKVVLGSSVCMLRVDD
ncbi:MAG: MOSC domain-containing protein [Chloroflexota bacterium]